MIKSKKLLPFLILSTALTFSGCSGQGGDNIQQVNNVENNSSNSEATNSAPDKAKKPKRGKKVNYDNLAEAFLLGDIRDIYGVTQGFDTEIKPSSLCFNYWYKRGEYTPTNEQKGNCQLWVQDVADLYTSYGYNVKTDMFKSELFWAGLHKYGEENFKKAYIAAEKNNTVTPDCSTRPQTNYRQPEIIEDLKKYYECEQFEIK